MNSLKFVVPGIFIILISGCIVTTPEDHSLTPLEIQSLQTREYKTPKGVVFPSVVSVFQDLGYIIKTADKDTGFITAESATRSSTAFDLFKGMMEVATQVAATAFIEEIGKVTRVRINIVDKESSSATQGQTTRGDSPVLDAEIYRNAFERIENAIFIRSGS